VPIVLKSGSLNLLETSGPIKACNWIALPFRGLCSSGTVYCGNSLHFFRLPETAVMSYHPTLHNIQEEFRPHLNRGKSLKLCIYSHLLQIQHSLYLCFFLVWLAAKCDVKNCHKLAFYNLRRVGNLKICEKSTMLCGQSITSYWPKIYVNLICWILEFPFYKNSFCRRRLVNSYWVYVQCWPWVWLPATHVDLHVN
jgi:hypothetical protein